MILERLYRASQVQLAINVTLKKEGLVSWSWPRTLVPLAQMIAVDYFRDHRQGKSWFTGKSMKGN